MKNRNYGTVLNLTLLSCGVLGLIFTLLAAGVVAAVFYDSYLTGANLAETLTVEDFAGGTLTIDHPEGWVAQSDPDTLLLGSSDSALAAVAAGPAALEDDQRIVRIAAEPDDRSADNPIAFLETHGADITGAALGAPQDTPIATYEGAYADLEGEQGGIYAIQLPDGNFITVIVAAEDFNAFTVDSEAMVGSLTFTPAEAAPSDDDAPADETTPEATEEAPEGDA